MKKSGVSKFNDMLLKNIESRNRVTEREFEKYKPLYQYKVRKTDIVDIGYVTNLITEFSVRFSQYHPITIVNDSDEVIEVLPPVSLRIPLLNNSVEHVDTLLQSYNTINENPNQPVAKKEGISHILLKAVEHTLKNGDDYKKEHEEAFELVSKRSGINKTESTDKLKNENGKWDWE